MEKRPLLAVLVTVAVAAALMVADRKDPASPAAPEEPVPQPTAAGGKVRPMIISPTPAIAVGAFPSSAATVSAADLPDPASRVLPPVATAIADFAGQAQVDPAAVILRQFERVTWPDGSLGCPQPGMMYTQALIDGYWLELAAGDRSAEYHTDLDGRAVSCRSGPPTGSGLDSTQ